MSILKQIILIFTTLFALLGLFLGGVKYYIEMEEFHWGRTTAAHYAAISLSEMIRADDEWGLFNESGVRPDSGGKLLRKLTAYDRLERVILMDASGATLLDSLGGKTVPAEALAMAVSTSSGSALIGGDFWGNSPIAGIGGAPAGFILLEHDSLFEEYQAKSFKNALTMFVVFVLLGIIISVSLGKFITTRFHEAIEITHFSGEDSRKKENKAEIKEIDDYQKSIQTLNSIIGEYEGRIRNLNRNDLSLPDSGYQDSIVSKEWNLFFEIDRSPLQATGFRINDALDTFLGYCQSETSVAFFAGRFAASNIMAAVQAKALQRHYLFNPDIPNPELFCEKLHGTYPFTMLKVAFVSMGQTELLLREYDFRKKHWIDAKIDLLARRFALTNYPEDISSEIQRVAKTIASKPLGEAKTFIQNSYEDQPGGAILIDLSA